MDVFCPICGEPWDTYEFHDVPGMTYAEAWKAFTQKGCEVFGTKHGEPLSKDDRGAIRLLYDVMGDDVDGAAAIIDDCKPW